MLRRLTAVLAAAVLAPSLAAAAPAPLTAAQFKAMADYVGAAHAVLDEQKQQVASAFIYSTQHTHDAFKDLTKKRDKVEEIYPDAYKALPDYKAEMAWYDQAAKADATLDEIAAQKKNSYQLTGLLNGMENREVVLKQPKRFKEEYELLIEAEIADLTKAKDMLADVVPADKPALSARLAKLMTEAQLKQYVAQHAGDGKGLPSKADYDKVSNAVVAAENAFVPVMQGQNSATGQKDLFARRPLVLQTRALLDKVLEPFTEAKSLVASMPADLQKKYADDGARLSQLQATQKTLDASVSDATFAGMKIDAAVAKARKDLMDAVYFAQQAIQRTKPNVLPFDPKMQAYQNLYDSAAQLGAKSSGQLDQKIAYWKPKIKGSDAELGAGLDGLTADLNAIVDKAKIDLSAILANNRISAH